MIITGEGAGIVIPKGWQDSAGNITPSGLWTNDIPVYNPFTPSGFGKFHHSSFLFQI